MSDKLTAEDIATLSRPFPVSDHEFINERVYIKEFAVVTRIEEIDPAWGFVRAGELAWNDNQVTVFMAMTIKGVSRSNSGSAVTEYLKAYQNKQATDFRRDFDGNKVLANEAIKSATTDALKRCARLFGVGRYLLNVPSGVKNHEQLGAWLGLGNPSSGDFSRVGKTTTTSAGTPPQNGKSGGKKQESVHWTQTPEWESFVESCATKYGLFPKVDEGWQEFNSKSDAGNIVRGKAESECWPMIATSAKYTKMKDSNAGTIEFNTDLPCRTYQGRTWLAKQMELDENAFKTWVSGREYDLPFPVLIEWAREGNTRGNAGYRVVKSVKVLPLESEES